MAFLMLEDLKLLEGSVEGAGEGGFVAEEHLEGAAVVDNALEGPGEAGFVVLLFQFLGEVAGLFEEIVGEHFGFDGREAADAPAGGG